MFLVLSELITVNAYLELCFYDVNCDHLRGQFLTMKCFYTAL